MYKCKKCGTDVLPGLPRQMIVISKSCQHPYRRAVNKKIVYEKGKKKIDWTDDPGGWGTEIISEIPVCLSCLQKHNEKYKNVS